MENSLFFNNIEENDKNSSILKALGKYAKENPNEQLYLITAPLSEQKYNYDYEENAIVVLSPKHRKSRFLLITKLFSQNPKAISRGLTLHSPLIQAISALA